MKKSNNRSVIIRIPTQVAERVDLRLIDPVRGRVRYGARSKLVTALLRRWLQGKREEPN